MWLATTDGLGTGKYVVASMAATSWHRYRCSLDFLVAVASRRDSHRIVGSGPMSSRSTGRLRSCILLQAFIHNHKYCPAL